MDDIKLRPSAIYGCLCIAHWLGLSACFLFLAYYLFPAFIFISLPLVLIAFYRYLLIRCTCYRITREVLEVSSGICFKRTDSLELYRVKDYVITRPLTLQAFGLMNLSLMSTDRTNSMVTLTGIPLSDITDTIRERVQQARKDHNIVELN